TLILESAGLTPVVDAFVDADHIRTESLPSPPAPDLLFAALRQARVGRADAVAFTASPAELAAARTAGTEAIGIAAETQRNPLFPHSARSSSVACSTSVRRSP